MEIFFNISSLKKQIFEIKNSGKTVGFVPTMGALHSGHLDLVKKAKNENDFVVVSIFVNPTQFNNAVDLQKYPRMSEKDSELLEKINCDILFSPTESEMYPNEESRKNPYFLNHLDKVMEGKFRKGHFDGVAVVVAKLFEIVSPHKAYFGEKDFQQLTIIRFLNEKYLSNLNIEIIPCPTIREKDGLAMSSRNLRLSEEQRKNSVLISQTLFQAKNLRNISVSELKKWVIETIDANPFLKTEYFEIVDTQTLQNIDSWEEKNQKIGCIAVMVGEIRLIDNVFFEKF